MFKTTIRATLLALALSACGPLDPTDPSEIEVTSPEVKGAPEESRGLDVGSQISDVEDPDGGEPISQHLPMVKHCQRKDGCPDGGSL